MQREVDITPKWPALAWGYSIGVSSQQCAFYSKSQPPLHSIAHCKNNSVLFPSLPSNTNNWPCCRSIFIRFGSVPQSSAFLVLAEVPSSSYFGSDCNSSTSQQLEILFRVRLWEAVRPTVPARIPVTRPGRGSRCHDSDLQTLTKSLCILIFQSVKALNHASVTFKQF